MSSLFSRRNIQLFFPLDLSVSWLTAHSSAEACSPSQQYSFRFLSEHQFLPDQDLSLSSGMDMEEKTRQMKLKMNKYKHGAGSDSRLEQDYHKVKTQAGRYTQYVRLTKRYTFS